MKRLALVITGGALWLFLAAIPVLADGGPHVSAINDGSLGINADSCAGCHRAHTAQGPFLINAADEEALCLTCHGASGTGSTVDVMTGVQYTLGTTGLRSGTILGAARNGGFDQARIDSSNTARQSYLRNATDVSQRAKVGVQAVAENVTSSHLDLDGDANKAPGIAWGNGANGSGAGPVVEMSCASCHNPHGNGQYRILNPIPEATGTGFVDTAVAAAVDDAPLPPAGDTRNYTVIQARGTEGTNSSYLLYASQVAGTYGPTQGDYLHRTVPWNPQVLNPACLPGVFPAPAGCATANDAPNGKPSTFSTQITAWCSACHTRYFADRNPNPGGLPGPNGEVAPADAQAWWFPRPGDDLYKYQHRTVPNRACVTCHVSHGSNASMTGTFSATAPYPNGVKVASSRLLKIDNRGTCQACHDPTETTVPGDYVGPLPMPSAP